MRKLVQTVQTRTVKRDGKHYEFTRIYDPSCNKTELLAFVWTDGRFYKTLHRIVY